MSAVMDSPTEQATGYSRSILEGMRTQKELGYSPSFLSNIHELEGLGAFKNPTILAEVRRMGDDPVIWETLMIKLYNDHEFGDRVQVQQGLRTAQILGIPQSKNLPPATRSALLYLQKTYTDADPTPKPDSLTLRGKSRRKFLKGVARTAAVATGLGVGTTAFFESDPEVRSATRAVLARPFPPSTEDQFDKVNIDEILSAKYDKYFKGRENILSREAWMGNNPNAIGRSMAKLANLYYFSEKGRGENFIRFYDRFIDQLAEASKDANLDFIILVSSLLISAENIGTLKNYRNDVFPTGFLQLAGVSTFRRLGGQEYFPELMMSYNPVKTKLYPKLQESSFKEDTASPKEGWNINAICRFPMEITTGMMDFEPSMRARALLLFGSPDAKKIFTEKYPGVVRQYQRILDRLGINYQPLLDSGAKPTESLAAAKGNLESEALSYLDHFAKRLDVFAQSDDALADIGIKVPIDPWQKFNRTDIWYMLNKRRDQNTQDERLNEPGAVAEFKELTRAYFDRDRPHYYYALMSQQILNPKFIQYLIQGATKDGNQTEMAQLQKMQGLIDTYHEQAKLTRTAFMDAVTEEGPLEFDSEFQTLASAVITKMLSGLGGSFDPNSKNSLYWNVYRAVMNRELSQPFTLVEDSGFAPDVLVDPVYAIRPNLDYLDRFVNLLKQKGILTDPPDVDVFAVDRAIQSIRSNDFSAYESLNLSGEDRELIYWYCRFHVLDMGDVGISRSHHVLSLATV